MDSKNKKYFEDFRLLLATEAFIDRRSVREVGGEGGRLPTPDFGLPTSDTYLE
jgi:hypothetical protein